MGNGCDMETYGDLGVEKCKYKKTAIAFWRKFRCVFFLQVAWCRLTKYGVSHSSKYQFWCQSFWMDLMCFWWCVGSRLIVFFKYTFGRFSSGFLLPQPASPPHSPHVLEMVAQSFGGSQVHQETKVTIENGAVVVHWQGLLGYQGWSTKNLAAGIPRMVEYIILFLGRSSEDVRSACCCYPRLTCFCPYLGPWPKGFYVKQGTHSQRQTITVLSW